METVEIDKEKFHMQRAFMYALTIRSDVTSEVKELIEKIERTLSKNAGVASVFEASEAEK